MPNEKRVLIVDDEPDAIDIVEAMLSEIEGITTFSANDGDSGLEKAKEIIPDLIILDVHHNIHLYHLKCHNNPLTLGLSCYNIPSRIYYFQYHKSRLLIPADPPSTLISV